jgi:hypothetical protein
MWEGKARVKTHRGDRDRTGVQASRAKGGQTSSESRRQYMCRRGLRLHITTRSTRPTHVRKTTSRASLWAAPTLARSRVDRRTKDAVVSVRVVLVLSRVRGDRQRVEVWKRRGVWLVHLAAARRLGFGRKKEGGMST